MKPKQKAEYERVRGAARSPFVFEAGKRFYAGERVQLRFHEEMEIKYIRSGRLSVNLGSQVIASEAGDLVIINPYEYHSNIVLEGVAEYDMLCVDLSASSMGGILAELFFPYLEGQYRFHNLIRDPSVVQSLEALFHALEREDLLSAVGQFALFFSSLEAYKETSPALFGREYSARQRDFLFTVLSHIHENYGRSIRLSELSSLCYMTEAHFCRTFRDLMGEPPVSYINRYRINKAAVMMQATELPIKEIAARVGFTDVAYFSRAFKKYKGEAPKLFLKSGAQKI